MTYTVNLWSPNPAICIVCGSHAYATVGGLYYSCFDHIQAVEDMIEKENIIQVVDPVTFDEGEG